MSLTVFRKNFTNVVDHPKVKMGMAIGIPVFVTLSGVFAFFVGKTISASCQPEGKNCLNTNLLAVGVGLGMVFSSVCFVSLLVLGVIFLRKPDSPDQTPLVKGHHKPAGYGGFNEEDSDLPTSPQIK